MAQTKRKRRSKHRGTPAGTIEARGRTGRKPTGTERKQLTKEEERRARMMRAPTWKGAATRAGIAALTFFALVVLILGQSPATAAGGALFAFAFYVPFGYYFDLMIYRRRQRKKAQAAAK